MSLAQYQSALRSLLARAKIIWNGPNPWDIRVRDPEFARRVLTQGSLGAGESYMEGQWDCERLDEMLVRIMRAGIDRSLPNFRELWVSVTARLFNPQTPTRSFKVGERHYDIGDDLYQRMLDRRMIYSCAYWRGAQTLDEAQEAKLDLICRKLQFQPGMRVLDIGCGWGGAARFAAERYGVNVVGVTISRNQAASATQCCKNLAVKILLQDYRTLPRDYAGGFDRIYSLGMFEHVGLRNYRDYFNTARQLLAPNGLFLLHTIGQNISQRVNDPWIERYIFPNSMIPSMAQIAGALEAIFVVEDWHGFGSYYDQTLMAWHERFNARWPEIKDRYDERFRRMWNFWLLASAAHFRARRNQLWQVVLSPNGVPGGYQEVR
jgi:cyclopropane-fatty-acyl-phospholipid synthase